MIRLENVSKFYYSKGVISVGFSRVNLNFDIGEFVAITGESGSGKSTLLNVISGLDTYEEGEMYIDGSETSHYTEKDFENYRRRYIGNIFQNFNLVNSYTVYQNIELVMLLNGSKRSEVKSRVNALIEQVGLTEYKHTKASKLSGGQKQRVAIARALAKDTPIIIADEPTGNLDSESASGIIKLLSEIAKDKLVVIVTHNYDQVEPYVTRKIKMHDGKVLEDVVLKNKELEAESASEGTGTSTKGNAFKNIRPLSQLRLGVRNAFNIPMKFFLLVFVFLFISVSIVSELSIFKSEQYDNGLNGWNYYFNNTSEKRVVIKKTDGSAITAEDLAELEALDNVDYIVENDILEESSVNFETCQGEDYIYGKAISVSAQGIKPDVGRLPEKDNEVVLIMEHDNYILEDSLESMVGKELYRYDDAGLNKGIKYTVVGIQYLTDEFRERYYSDSGSYVCVTDTLLEKLLLETNTHFGNIKVVYNEKTHDATDMSSEYPMFYITTSPAVKPGEAAVSQLLNDYAAKNKALGTDIKVTLETPYYNDEMTVKVTKLYNKWSFKNYYSFDDGMTNNDWEGMNGYIFVNPDDYKKLFDKDTYQSSVFVKDPLKIDETNSAIKEMGYTTIVMKDALYDSTDAVIIKILSYMVTAGLAVALFFISYFVIRIILKSRNVYYSTIRMLGANVGVSRTLLLIDLLTDANIAFALTMGIVKLLSVYYPKVFIVEAMTKFMGFTDYAAIYLIVACISILISLRYSKKLFKNSTIETIKEEV